MADKVRRRGKYKARRGRDKAGPLPPVGIPGICRRCGCTAMNACCHADLGTCSWAEADLCDFCDAIDRGELDRTEVEQPADRAEMMR